MAAKWQKLDIDVPDDLGPSERKKVADLVIDHIIRRTESGKDKNGDKFPAYSEDYVDSLDFKIAGKSKSRVDLKLSGDMLASLDLLTEKKGMIRIGFEKGSEENARADGNIRGTYGADSPKRGKKRDFLGIDRKVLKQIIDEVRDDNEG